MIIKQVAVFIENKLGRLVEITDFLSENGVNLHALSITDTTDYGILRIVVDDPDGVAKLLKKNGFAPPAAPRPAAKKRPVTRVESKPVEVKPAKAAPSKPADSDVKKK